jgi:hypothetical protein
MIKLNNQYEATESRAVDLQDGGKGQGVESPRRVQIEEHLEEIKRSHPKGLALTWPE